MPNIKAQQNFSIQKWIFALSVFLFIIKLTAWYLTDSSAIFSDAMESIVNVIAGFIGVVSLYVAAMPKDKNHPYGHGKVEFLSAAAEGVLILLAGLIIFYETGKNFLVKKEVVRLDFGLLLTVFTGLANYLAGRYCLRSGKMNNSLALQASGKHLITDTYSTIGVVVGLIIILITKQYILDKIIALAMGALIVYNGIKIIRAAFSGIMDEADQEILNKVVIALNRNRNPEWIDVHNLRVQKYGANMHMDCHLTLPWYSNLRQAHNQINIFTQMLEVELGDKIEFFIHTDDCRESSCPICLKEDCPVRLHAFTQKIEWDMQNIAENRRHDINT